MCAAPASAAVAPRIVVGLGEILWDVFSDTKRKLGGAPTNFCYHAHALGDRGVVCSRVGNDELGREAKAILDARGVDTRLMQKSLDRPTGRVLVKLSASGSATYEFEDDSAWDALELTDDWKCLAQTADAVCFGSLAQRGAQSRETIAGFLAATRPECMRIFDVNLRQAFYNREILSTGLHHAQICKLNDEEAEPLLSTLGLEAAETLEVCADRLLAAFPNLGLVCITRGGEGATLVSRAGRVHVPAEKVTIVDTIGAGDAFTAALARSLMAEAEPPAQLSEAALATAARFASKYAAYVCGHAGGMPDPPSWLGKEGCVAGIGAK